MEAAGYDPVSSVQRLMDHQEGAEAPLDSIRAAELLLKAAGVFDEDLPSEQHSHVHVEGVTIEDTRALRERNAANMARIE